MQSKSTTARSAADH